jgi:hypothetical protein
MVQFTLLETVMPELDVTKSILFEQSTPDVVGFDDVTAPEIDFEILFLFSMESAT